MSSRKAPFDIAKFRKQIHSLSNAARFDEARELAQRELRKHPDHVELKFNEIVFKYEQHEGFTPAQIRRRHAQAARELRKLLLRARALDYANRGRLRNEYYWFSHQPLKQFKLGVEQVKNGYIRAWYSQGVGAIEVAKQYGLQGRRGLCLRWAKIAERAWLEFFKHDANWFNSYFFYAMALGYQGRLDEMDHALARARRIARKPEHWSETKSTRKEIMAVVESLTKRNSG